MEQWKDIEGYEGLYQVSDLGNVKALKKQWYTGRNNSTLKSKKEHLLKQFISPNSGYYFVKLNNGVRKYHFVHRLVYEAFNGKTDLQVDHIVEGNKLDNRLCNLQAISGRDNVSKYFKTKQLTSKFTGVYLHKRTNKWCATITKNRKQIHLGLFLTEEEASNCYQESLKQFYAANA